MIDTQRQHKHNSSGEFCLRVGFAANVLLVGGKLAGGIIGHSQGLIADAFNSLRSVPGVLGLHRTKVRIAGRRLLVNTEILVDGALSVEDAHEIANRTGDIVMTAHPAIDDVVVHVEPHTPERDAEGANPLTPRHRARGQEKGRI